MISFHRSRVFAAVLIIFAVSRTYAGIEVNPARPKIPERTFKVSDYGLIGRPGADETAAIQAALDAAKAAGGGTVEIPQGTFLSGPLHLSSHTCLFLHEGAVLRMLPLDRYPGGSVSPDDFIGASDIHDVAITGKGVIDGQGTAWWPNYKVKGFKRPRMIALKSCDRILIEGVTLKDSPMFHIAIGGGSTNVTVKGVTIRAPSSKDPVNPSHNTDACDVSGENVLVEDCDVSVGDDNFTCGGGTSRVLITHCRYGSGHGVSIGSYTKGGVSNLAVTHCTFTGTECGIRIKTDRDRGGHVHNIVYSDLQMTDVEIPILVYAAYMAPEKKYRDMNNLTPEIAASYPGSEVTKLTPFYSEIVFVNITATAVKGHRAGLIWGLPEAKANNILLRNVLIEADKPFGIFNAKNVRLENCQIKTQEGLNKVVSSDADVKITP